MLLKQRSQKRTEKIQDFEKYEDKMFGIWIKQIEYFTTVQFIFTTTSFLMSHWNPRQNSKCFPSLIDHNCDLEKTTPTDRFI